MNISLIMSLTNASNEKIIEFAKDHKIDLSREEVQYLRKVLEDANFEWIISGIPDYVLKDLKSKLGEKKLKAILKLLQ